MQNNTTYIKTIKTKAAKAQTPKDKRGKAWIRTDIKRQNFSQS